MHSGARAASWLFMGQAAHGGDVQASLVASSMQALALQLSSAMCSRGNSPTLGEWVAVAGEAWACIGAETLVPRTSPLADAPPSVPRRLSLTREADACMVRFRPLPVPRGTLSACRVRTCRNCLNAQCAHGTASCTVC